VQRWWPILVRRRLASLNNENRPYGVILFCCQIDERVFKIDVLYLIDSCFIFHPKCYDGYSINCCLDEYVMCYDGYSINCCLDEHVMCYDGYSVNCCMSKRTRNVL
jgi:hypothetical protein